MTGKGSLAERRRLDADTYGGRRRLQGALVLVACLAIVVVLYAKPDPFADTRTVRIAVDDADGTEIVGGEVRMGGTPVGRVTNRRRVGDDAVLELELERDAGAVTTMATAEIRPRTAFEGPVFIDLDPGPPGAPDLEDSTLPNDRSRNYVPLPQALRFAQPEIRAALQASLGELRAATSETGSRGLRRVLRAAPGLTEKIVPAARAARGATGTELSGAIASMAETTRAIARESDNFISGGRAGQRAFRSLNADGGAPLGRTVADLDARLASLDAGGRRLAALVGTVRDVGTELRPALRELVPTAAVLAPLLRSAPATLEDAAPLLRDVRAVVQEGGAAAAPGRTLLENLRPTLALLDDSLLPALLRPSELGIPTYLQFISLFQGGGGASRGFQTPAQAGFPSTGAGHFMRFNARFFTGMGFPLPSCALLEQFSPQLAAAFTGIGGCAP